MASITVDSELMCNYVSSVPVPAGSHHVAVLDEKRMPMVFCLSNDQQPRLRVLCKDERGSSDLIDIHDLIGLPRDARIQAFHAEQSWSLKIYLCVGFEMDNVSSEIIVLKPFSPEDLKSRTSLAKVNSRRRLGTIQKIHMSPISGINHDYKYPDIFLVHRNLDQSTSWGSDITHIHVAARQEYWIATRELNTPENVSAILDIAPAVSPYGQGLYVLYVSQGVTKIFARFLRPDPNADDGSMFSFVTDVKCPKGARSISSIVNERGYTCLLIAASDGIRYLDVAASTSKDNPGKLLFDEDIFRNTRQLYVAQDKSDVTIWFRTIRDELAYTRSKREDLAGSAVTSLLLSAKLSTSFAPVVTRADALTGNTVRQMLISNDNHGNLMLLEQASDIGLWRKTPFYAPSSTTATEIKSYTVTMKAKENKDVPLSNGAVLLSASSTVSTILNGQNTLLTQVPIWFDCDENGSLDFIIPSDSLGSQTLRIDSLRTRDGDILDLQQVLYDPASKPMMALAKKLGELKDGHDFSSLKTCSGGSLFDADVSVDKNIMDGAFGCLKTITQAYSQLPGSGVSAKIAASASFGKVVTAAESASEDVGDLLLDGWYWVREQMDNVTEWIIDTAGTVWKFVCKIAGQIKEFVLDCVEKICEAATWIWEKVKVGWNKLVEFVGFLFDWDDILTTKDTISSLLTAGFGYAAIKIDDITQKVDGFFEQLEETIDKFGNAALPTKEQTAETSDKNKKVQESQSGTSTSWATERLKNGGAGSKTKVKTKGAKTSSEATSFWKDTIAPEMTKLDEQLSLLGNGFTAAFKKEGGVDGNDIINIAKPLLKSGIIAVRAIVKGLLQLMKTLVLKIQELGNAEIDIPIFSWLYQKITKGHALTLFDAISLVVAIPTTVCAKLITGKAPPKVENLDAPLLKKLVEDDRSLSENIKTDFDVFKAEVTIGLSLTVGTFAVLKLLYKMATMGLDDVLDELDEGPSSLFDIFGICTDMIGCIVAIPTQSDLPGAAYRNWISGIAFTRGAYHTLAYFSKSKGKLEKVILGLDLLTVLATFGLSLAVGIAEHEAAATWDDYEEDDTNTGMITAGLNALAGIGYFTAFMFKATNPDISAGGAAVMIGTMGGTAALEGIMFKLQYDALRRPRLVSGPGI
ncbi:hypothetical protein VTK73DRAFT_9153 [Phialemonium thermophilum]|uniref:Uncharacterized protein n=1 Tax=Phialemonium thermophilum TaxID=223376 RepID=A0ABR3XM88_9PEZI